MSHIAALRGLTFVVEARFPWLILVQEECCGTGWAQASLVADEEPVKWEAGRSFMRGLLQSRHRNHSSHSHKQRRWEASAQHGSRMATGRSLLVRVASLQNEIAHVRTEKGKNGTKNATKLSYPQLSLLQLHNIFSLVLSECFHVISSTSIYIYI